MALAFVRQQNAGFELHRDRLSLATFFDAIPPIQ
jgi:hypothetical protein